jgi:2-polyprenyl-3-methyl-5-hydroxy-6-metoxy-1,4-benzoquinol methylase
MEDYRQRILKQYPSLMRGESLVFDTSNAISWAKPYNFYLRSWLPIQKSVSICDAGCGSGKFLYFMKLKGYTDLIGIDISDSQLNIARQTGVQVINADAIEFLISHKASFDLIVAIDIIEHFSKNDALRFIDASYEALRSCGRLIIQTPNPESPWGAQIFYGDLTHEVAFAPELLTKLLSAAGFSKVVLRETGPVAHGLLSLIRRMLWKALHCLMEFWNMIEKGDKGSNIYTRVYLISGIKRIKEDF